MVDLENFLLDVYEKLESKEINLLDCYSGIHLADFYLTKMFEWDSTYLPWLLGLTFYQNNHKAAKHNQF